MEENKTNVTETKQEDKGLSQIQPNEKRSWWSIAFIWVGTMICIPMLMVGGIFGSVLTMSSIFWATLIGVMPAALLMILVGAIMSIGTGNYDVAAMFAGLGLPIIAMVVLILATWTTNTGNAYMSGLAACKMFSIKDSKRPLVTMLCGVLGVILAIAGLADFLNTYISILGAVVPPIMGVVICDYWVVCKAKKENWSPVRGINWIGIIAWVIGGGFALLETLGVVTVFSSALDGVIIAFVAYRILYALLKNTKLAGSGDMTIEEACSVAQ